MGVVSNNWFDRVLCSIPYMFKPSCRPMFKPPSLGPPYFPLESPLGRAGHAAGSRSARRRSSRLGARRRTMACVGTATGDFSGNARSITLSDDQSTFGCTFPLTSAKGSAPQIGSGDGSSSQRCSSKVPQRIRTPSDHSRTQPWAASSFSMPGTCPRPTTPTMASRTRRVGRGSGEGPTVTERS